MTAIHSRLRIFFRVLFRFYDDSIFANQSVIAGLVKIDTLEQR